MVIVMTEFTAIVELALFIKGTFSANQDK